MTPRPSPASRVDELLAGLALDLAGRPRTIDGPAAALLLEVDEKHNGEASATVQPLADVRRIYFQLARDPDPRMHPAGRAGVKILQREPAAGEVIVIVCLSDGSYHPGAVPWPA